MGEKKRERVCEKEGVRECVCERVRGSEREREQNGEHKIRDLTCHVHYAVIFTP